MTVTIVFFLLLGLFWLSRHLRLGRCLWLRRRLRLGRCLWLRRRLKLGRCLWLSRRLRLGRCLWPSRRLRLAWHWSRIFNDNEVNFIAELVDELDDFSIFQVQVIDVEVVKNRDLLVGGDNFLIDQVDDILNFRDWVFNLDVLVVESFLNRIDKLVDVDFLVKDFSGEDWLNDVRDDVISLVLTNDRRKNFVESSLFDDVFAEFLGFRDDILGDIHLSVHVAIVDFLGFSTLVVAGRHAWHGGAAAAFGSAQLSQDSGSGLGSLGARELDCLGRCNEAGDCQLDSHDQVSFS